MTCIHFTQSQSFLLSFTGFFFFSQHTHIKKTLVSIIAVPGHVTTMVFVSTLMQIRACRHRCLRQDGNYTVCSPWIPCSLCVHKHFVSSNSHHCGPRGPADHFQSSKKGQLKTFFRVNLTIISLKIFTIHRAYFSHVEMRLICSESCKRTVSLKYKKEHKHKQQSPTTQSPASRYRSERKLFPSKGFLQNAGLQRSHSSKRKGKEFQTAGQEKTRFFEKCSCLVT